MPVYVRPSHELRLVVALSEDRERIRDFIMGSAGAYRFFLRWPSALFGLASLRQLPQDFSQTEPKKRLRDLLRLGARLRLRELPSQDVPLVTPRKINPPPTENIVRIGSNRVCNRSRLNFILSFGVLQVIQKIMKHNM